MRNTVKLIITQFTSRTITRDLTFGLVLIITVTLVSIGGLNYVANTIQAKNNLITQAEETAEKLSNILSVPLWALDSKTVKKTAETYLQENVVGVSILDEAGNAIYTSTTIEENLITAERTIYHDDIKIGYVKVALSTKNIRALQTNILITTSLSVFLVGLALLMATGMLLELFLNRPLKMLTSGIDQIANGRYAQILEHAPQADINEIVQSVNVMASQIAERVEALRRESDIIGRIMETSPVGIIMMNQDSQITFANPQAKKILELNTQDVTQHLDNALVLHMTDLDGNHLGENELPFRRVMSTAQPVYEMQYAITQADGLRILISINAAPLLNESGHADGMVATIDNITERKQAEQELHQRLTELEAVHRISTVLRTAKTLDEMLPRLLDETLAVLATEAGAILLFDPIHNVLRSTVARGWFQHLTESPLKPNEGIAGFTFVSGKPHVSYEFAKDSLVHESSRNQIPPGWGGVCIPISSVDETLGALFISVALPRQLQPENIQLLITLAEIAGNAFHRTRLHDQTEQRLQRLAALHTIDMAISANVDLRLTMNILVDQAITHLGVDAADVLLFDPRLLTLEYAAGQGFRTDYLTPTRLTIGQGLAGRAALERRIVKIQDWRSEPGLTDLKSLTAKFQAEEFISYYGVPLIIKEQIKGVLEIFHRTPLVPDPEWLDFLVTLGGQAAIAIDDAQLFSSLQRSNFELALAYDTTLEGWSRALDLRDKETEGHTQRVKTMTIQLAQKMGLGEDEIVFMRRGALLHDIGKMGIPDDILHKPGNLTKAEKEIMRRHPNYAYEMLSPILYLQSALDIPFCHHEKWDGTGYPRGLKGEAIPLSARIFAVVDVWDALTSDRPYRLAWSDEKALAHIREQSGKHFDPHIVKIFLEMILGS